MSEFLAPEEVKTLTACTPTTKQDAWLTENGIPHKIARKRIIVSREHVRAWLEGRPLRMPGGINWDAVK